MTAKDIYEKKNSDNSNMQSFRLKWGERSNEWRCCFCCHVRTGTIVIGAFYLIRQAMVLASLCILKNNPELIQSDMDPALPTPVSKIYDNRNLYSGKPEEPLTDEYRSFILRDYLDVTICITLFVMCIIVFLLYGAVKRKASYLLPFFFYIILDFIMVSGEAIGYLFGFSNFERNEHRLLKNMNIPESEISPQFIHTCTFFALVLPMITKAYIMYVILKCHQYLRYRQVASQRTLHIIEQQDSNTLIQDLPSYETAVKKYPTPPPSYAAALGDVAAPEYSVAVATEGAQPWHTVHAPAPVDPKSSPPVQHV